MRGRANWVWEKHFAAKKIAEWQSVEEKLLINIHKSNEIINERQLRLAFLMMESVETARGFWSSGCEIDIGLRWVNDLVKATKSLTCTYLRVA